MLESKDKNIVKDKCGIERIRKRNVRIGYEIWRRHFLEILYRSGGTGSPTTEIEKPLSIWVLQEQKITHFHVPTQKQTWVFQHDQYF